MTIFPNKPKLTDKCLCCQEDHPVEKHIREMFLTHTLVFCSNVLAWSPAYPCHQVTDSLNLLALGRRQPPYISDDIISTYSYRESDRV